MSENATPESAATPASNADQPTKPVVNLDEFGKQIEGRLTAQINEHNVFAKQVKAANGDPLELLQALRESPPEDNADAVKLAGAIEDLDNKREALVTRLDEVLKPIVEAQVEAAKSGTGDAEAKAADLLKVINAGKKYLIETYGEGADANLPAVVGKRRASSGASGGSGQRRIRGFDVYIDGTLATGRNGKGEQVSNMAAAAKILGVETEDLRNAFFQAAGTDDSSKYPAEVTFTVTVSEGEGDAAKSVTKTIVAKRVKEDEARATEAAAPAA